MFGIQEGHYFTPVFQVCLLLYALQGPIRGSPPVLVNGILGESVVLPSGLDERQYSSVSPDLVQWERDGKTVIQFINNKTVETNLSRGRVSLSTEDGSLTISSLKAEDRGNYMFSGGGSSEQFPGKSVTLHVYERIRSVQIQSQRSYGTDNKTCHLTLNCTVTGGSQVDLIWLKGKNKNPEETKQSVLQSTVKPTDDDYSYTCVASNPVSNQSDTIEGNECYTQDPNHKIETIYIAAAAAAGGFLFLVLLLITLVHCCCKNSKKEVEDPAQTLYAEIDNIHHRRNKSSSDVYNLPRELTTCYDVVKERKHGPPSQTLYDTVKFDCKEGFSQYQDVN